MWESNYDGVSVMELHMCSVRLLCVRFAVCESFGVKFAVCSRLLDGCRSGGRRGSQLELDFFGSGNHWAGRANEKVHNHNVRVRQNHTYTLQSATHFDWQ